jgi:hypothetical protein
MAPAAEALAHYFAGAVQAAAGQAAAAPAVRPTPPVTIVGPCLSYHVTCMHFCTHITPCHPTHGQPQCPFPTEVTCGPVCHASPAPAGCGVPGGLPGQAAMAAPCVGFSAVATVPIACTPACSIFCPTQQGWVCWSHRTPCCPVPVHTLFGATCAFICRSQQSLCCPVSPFCPPGTPACSLGCGPGQPGPVDQVGGMARGVSGAVGILGGSLCVCGLPTAQPCTPACEF